MIVSWSSIYNILALFDRSGLGLMYLYLLHLDQETA